MEVNMEAFAQQIRQQVLQDLQQQNQQAPQGVPKPTKPPEYSGDRETSEDWMFTVTHYFNLLNGAHNQPVGEAYKINFTVNLLRASAMHWWRTQVIHNHGQSPYNTFEEFRLAFLRRFQPVNSNTIARDKLYALRQTGTVAKYIDAFDKLSSRITDLSEAETLYRFIKGLQPNVKAWVKTKDCTTLQGAMSAAQAVGDNDSPGVPAAYNNDPMDVDMHALETEMNALSMQRRPKDRRPIFHNASMSQGNGYRTAPRSNSRERSFADKRRDPPPLRPGEMQALREQNKCFRCRRYGHQADECRTYPKKVRFASPQPGNRGRW